MKYGMRERVSGAIILIALAVIFVPMLFDDPAPRDERPQPVMSIEQPVPVERRDVPDPQPPGSLGEIRGPESAGEVGSLPEPVDIEPVTESDVEAADETAIVEVPPAEVLPPDTAQQTDEPPAEDPIADLARAASERMESQQAEPAPSTTPATPAGEWAVQVGSFGEPGNAERLQAQLEQQGFTVYSRHRDNNMTTVYVGPYDSSESGERAMAELKERANLQGLLVRVRE